MTFKPYLSFSRARKAAQGKVIVRVGNLWLVPDGDDEVSLRITEVALLTANGSYAGQVTLGHLDRLGNANWATPRQGQGQKPQAFKVQFPQPE